VWKFVIGSFLKWKFFDKGILRKGYSSIWKFSTMDILQNVSFQTLKLLIWKFLDLEVF